MLMDDMRALASPGGGRPQYGTSLHYPDCPGAGCSGCLPAGVVRVFVAPVHRWVEDHVDHVWAVTGGARYGCTSPETEVVFGMDVARGDQGEGRAVAFARIRDGVIGAVHVPEVR